MNTTTIWNSFLDNISHKISSISFSTWWKDTKLLELKDGKAKIVVPYDAHKIHLMNNYYDLIEETLLAITNDTYDIEIYLESEIPKKPDIITINETKEIEISNNEEDNETTYEQYKYYSNFNPNYTFETFVVGDSNRFAYSSALAVAQKPGTLYNPLFIYGKSGLGKTHLMHSIGNYIIEHSDKKVLYLTTEQFYNDFIAMCKKDSEGKHNYGYVEMFKKKYRDVDVLMIDDIQFLGGAIKSQQELTNTFNDLHDNDKQIIVVSDRDVNDLKLLEDRLKTRFNWGLKVNINPPEFDLKVNIIKNKIKTVDLAINLNDDIINYIASNFGSDVRNIEGAITRLCAYKAIMNIPDLKVEDAMEALQDYTKNFMYTTNTIVKIQNVITSYFHLEPEDLKSKKRSKNIAYARQIAMYLCRTLTEETHQKIGLEFGGRDHSTVIFAFEKITQDLQTNSQLDGILTELKKLICE